MWIPSYLRKLRFPEHPTGPFCYVRQQKHSTKSRRNRRLERKFKQTQRTLADTQTGDLPC
jgi:hypothetical protein